MFLCHSLRYKSKLHLGLTQYFHYLSFIAKVWRRWKETGWPEAQRKRPEQQHQPCSSSLLFRDRRLLNSPPTPCKAPSVLSLHQVSSSHKPRRSKFAKSLQSYYSLPFLHQVQKLLCLKGTQRGYVARPEGIQVLCILM